MLLGSSADDGYPYMYSYLAMFTSMRYTPKKIPTRGKLLATSEIIFYHFTNLDTPTPLVLLLKIFVLLIDGLYFLHEAI